MIVTCTYENFKEALSFIETAVSKNSTLSILNNILVEAKENKLHLSATNLEIGVIKKIPAKIEESGSIVIPINLLLNFLTALRGDNHIKLEIEENQLILKSGIHVTKINSYKSNDFPIIPQSVERNFSKFNLKVLKEIISKTLPFISSLETRQELMGVLLKKNDDKIYTVATDSFRLSENIITNSDLFNNSSDAKLNEDNFIIIPKQLCLFINKINDKNSEIDCSIENNHFFIECEDLSITAKLIDGNYPDYEQIIPKNSLTSVIVNKDEFVEALKVTTIFVNDSDKEIFLKISNDKLKITTKQQESGSSSTDLDIQLTGEEQEIAINPHFILEGIRKMGEDDIFMSISGKVAPVIFKGSKDNIINENFTYLVMPVKSVSK